MPDMSNGLVGGLWSNGLLSYHCGLTIGLKIFINTPVVLKENATEEKVTIKTVDSMFCGSRVTGTQILEKDDAD